MEFQLYVCVRVCVPLICKQASSEMLPQKPAAPGGALGSGRTEVLRFSGKSLNPCLLIPLQSLPGGT